MTMTKIQLQERAKRKRNQRRGLTQKKGTVVYAFKPTGHPWMKPGFTMPSSQGLEGLIGLVTTLFTLPKFWKRKKLGYDEAR